MKILVPEEVINVPHRKLFSFWGVDWLATPWAWLHLILLVVLGLVLSFLFAPSELVGEQILIGLGYAILLHLTMEFHGLGHLISGKLVGAPMYANVLTSTRFINLYADEQEYPSRIHLGRALGGPLFNGLVALVLFAIYAVGINSHFLLLLAISNHLALIGALAPIPTTDGGVILRELRNWKSS